MATVISRGVATTHWRGTMKDGGGTTTLSSGPWNGTFSARSKQAGASPEHLISAAQGNCLAMTIAARLGKQGAADVEIDLTTTTLLTSQDDGSLRITSLTVEGTVRYDDDGIGAVDSAELTALVTSVCPVSNAFTAIPTTVALEVSQRQS